MEQVLTAQELADYLRISRETVYSMARDNRIPVMRAGRTYRFKLAAVEQALAAGPEPGSWQQSNRSRGRKRRS